LFNISFSELILIVVIILILFNPKELLALIIILYQLYIKLKQNIQTITNDIEINIIKESIDTTDFVNLTNEDETIEELVYYQPELDFNKEPELFDELKS
jgi:Sec-independent protein translocase protein TatA